jgi:hypothetical protein
VVSVPALSHTRFGGDLLGACRIGGTNLVWAVGEVIHQGYTSSLVMRWDGHHWRIIRDALRGPLSGCVAASSNAWAIGPHGIQRWHGTQWVALPGAPSGVAIASTSPAMKTIWTVDAYAAHRWTSANGWDPPYDLPGVADANGGTADVTGRSGDVWATGISQAGYTYVNHWDGATWTPAQAGLDNGHVWLAAIARVPTTHTIWMVGTSTHNHRAVAYVGP